MARPLRIEIPDGLYHASSRGHRDEPIYEDDEDRRTFLDILGEVVERFDWRVHAYCQMTNHYHLVVETPEANLSEGMRHLNGVYTQANNRRHDRKGSVFQGRYKGLLVDPVEFLLPLARYIVLNPVRAGLVDAPGDWPWSSYRETAGDEAPRTWLDVSPLLARFADQTEEARKRYREFIEEGSEERNLWRHVRQQLYLADEAFIHKMHATGKIPDDPSILKEQRRPPVPSIDEFVKTAPSRNTAIIEAYRTGAYSYNDLGRHFGLHPGSIGRIVRGSITGSE